MAGSPLLLGLFMTGGALVTMGACLYVITDYRRLRRRILERLAGSRTGPDPEAGRPASLRPASLRPASLRIDTHGGARPAGLGPLAGTRLWRSHRRMIVLGGAGLCAAIFALGMGGLHLGAGWCVLGCAGALGAGAAMLPRWHARKLRAEIEAGVPDALDTAVRSLRIGIPISVVIRTLAEDTPGLLGAEFAFTADQINFGKDTIQALEELAGRCDNQTLRFLAAAVAIQSETGGNLAGLVEKLSMLARARIRLRRKIDSITAEAKWSGMFLSAFPLLAGGALWLMTPDYFAPMKGNALTLPVLGVVAALLLFNMIFMRRIVRFD